MSLEITVVPREDNGSSGLQPVPPHTTKEEPQSSPVAPPTFVQPIVPTKTEESCNCETSNKPQTDKQKKKEKRKDWFKHMRGWIMIVGVQVAAATYVSGLNPPGGFWPDDKENHTAGHAILHDKSKSRYTAFYYANATAFMASLVVIALLMNEKFYIKKHKVVALNFSMVLGLVSLMIAYAAGSARRTSTSIYVIILAGVVSLFVIYSSHILKYVGSWIAKCCPSIGRAMCPTCVQMLTRDEHAENPRLAV